MRAAADYNKCGFRLDLGIICLKSSPLLSGSLTSLFSLDDISDHMTSYVPVVTIIKTLLDNPNKNPCFQPIIYRKRRPRKVADSRRVRIVMSMLSRML